MNSSSTEASSQPPMIPIILTSIYDSSENICKPQVVYCGMMMIVMMIIHNALLFAVEKFSPSLPWYLDNVVLDFAVTFKMYFGTIWIQAIAPQISVGVIDNFTMKGMTYFNFICHPIQIHIFHFVFDRQLFSLNFGLFFITPSTDLKVSIRIEESARLYCNFSYNSVQRANWLKFNLTGSDDLLFSHL